MAAATLVMVAAACVPPPVAPPDPEPGDLQVVGQFSGFDRPWELRFTPDGTPLLTEKGGNLVTIDAGVRRVVGSVPGVVANGEGGLMGLAVDPAYAANRHVYVCFTTSSDVRVVRFTVGAGDSSLGGATPILTGIPSNGGVRHVGCRVAFGVGGELWVTTGDAVIPAAPADRSNLAGKVLRITSSGAPWPGNPASTDPGAGWNPLVYSRGHRNPQGLAIRPADGAVFVVEHGTGCDDEINRLAVGNDYGWNPVGPGGGYDESLPMTRAGATPAVWSSGCPTVAPSGAAFLDGDQWGARDGQLAVAMLKQQRLTLMDTSGAATVVVEELLVGQRRLRTVAQGPDGALWVVGDGAGAPVLRLASS